MNIHQLRSFSAAVKSGSFSAGARRENVTEAFLSRQIRRLEAELDAQLIRVGRTIKLTESGQSLFSSIQSVLSQLAGTKSAMAGVEGSKERLVVVGASPSVAPYTLPFAVADFQRKYPGVRVNVVEEFPRQLFDGLRTAEVDIGVIQLPVPGEEFLAEELIQEPLYAAVSDGHRLADRKTIDLREFQEEGPFILAKDELAFPGAVLKVLKRAAIQPDVVVEALSLTTILEMVSSGLGVSLIPEMALKRRSGCKFLRLQNLGSNRRVGLVRLRRRRFGPTKLLFIECLRRSLQNLPGPIM
jgi:LysR family transcriptional regulator, hydrogen peroxide-inducible genes activator